jgi:hypothetical protein
VITLELKRYLAFEPNIDEMSYKLTPAAHKSRNTLSLLRRLFLGVVRQRDPLPIGPQREVFGILPADGSLGGSISRQPRAMSVWWLIGVVIAIVWIVGVSTGLVASRNRTASHYYHACVSAKYEIASDYRALGRNDLANATDNAAATECWKVSGFTTFKQLVSDVMAGDLQILLMWVLLLLPIAMFFGIAIAVGV